ncbi:hypothetical protein BLOT_010432 [Blomia tropicalis]|nr:hypothetical protein BLOT_010432 [Blomia tropicalis]
MFQLICILSLWVNKTINIGEIVKLLVKLTMALSQKIGKTGMAIGIERPYFVDMVPLEPLFGFKKSSSLTSLHITFQFNFALTELTDCSIYCKVAALRWYLVLQLISSWKIKFIYISKHMQNNGKIEFKIKEFHLHLERISFKMLFMIIDILIDAQRLAITILWSLMQTLSLKKELKLLIVVVVVRDMPHHSVLYITLIVVTQLGLVDLSIHRTLKPKREKETKGIEESSCTVWYKCIGLTHMRTKEESIIKYTKYSIVKFTLYQKILVKKLEYNQENEEKEEEEEENKKKKKKEDENVIEASIDHYIYQQQEE